MRCALRKREGGLRGHEEVSVTHMSKMIPGKAPRNHHHKKCSSCSSSEQKKKNIFVEVGLFLQAIRRVIMMTMTILRLRLDHGALMYQDEHMCIVCVCVCLRLWSCTTTPKNGIARQQTVPTQSSRGKKVKNTKRQRRKRALRLPPSPPPPTLSGGRTPLAASGRAAPDKPHLPWP